VQLHHPDHNHGSPEAARRFEEVQEAYAAITRERRRSPTRHTPPPPRPTDTDVEQRLADLERELREKARAARARAQRAARDAAARRAAREATTAGKRPSDEELGYIKTDDTLGKILADARKEIADRLGDVRDTPVRDRVADLLEDVAAVLRDGRPGSADDANRKSRGPDRDNRS
jgi:hypothetical protein